MWLIGLLCTFLVALIESLPLFGTLVPGSITMTAIGALIGAAILPPIATFIAAILGAFAGDCLGFWLGDRYHATIRTAWPLNKLSKWINYSEKFFSNHGGKSIIIGRFIGPTRAAMPLIAGILRFTWMQFLGPAILAAVLWSLIYTLPGILLGALALEFPAGDITKVLMFGLASIFILWALFWTLQFFFKNLVRFINWRIRIWWDWLNRHETSSLFIRLISNRQQPDDYRQLTLTLLFLISGVLLLLLWINVIAQGAWTHANLPLFYLLQSLRSPSMDHFWVLITILASPKNLPICALLIAAGLAICKQWRAAVHLLLLVSLIFIGAGGMKMLHFSPRPAVGLAYVDPSSSFPSGHCALAMAIFGFLAFLTTKVFPRQRWSTLFFTILILLVGASRLFLGQHWLTDVLGAWLLGCCVLLIVIISYQRLPKISSALNLSRRRWLAILGVGILIPWIISAALHDKTELRDTAQAWPKITLSYQQWWRQPSEHVPLYRLDRFGKVAQPFNVQWAGTLDDIQTFLVDHGWEILDFHPGVKTAMQRFVSNAPAHNMPMISWLYQNQPPVVIFIKHLDRTADIMELRLWDSGVTFSDSTLPLWIGIVTYHTPPEKLLRFPQHYIPLQSSDVLLKLSRQYKNFDIQLVHIPTATQPERIQLLQWDGNIFILQPTSTNR